MGTLILSSSNIVLITVFEIIMDEYEIQSKKRKKKKSPLNVQIFRLMCCFNYSTLTLLRVESDAELVGCTPIG